MAILEIMTQKKVTRQIVLEAKEQNQMLYLNLNKDSKKIEVIQQRPEIFLAAMVPVNGRWVLMSHPDDTSLYVNQVPVIELKLLDHNDSIAKDDILLHFIEESSEIIAESSVLIKEKKSCPICQQDFEIGDEVIFCPKCGQAHHLLCWEEFGRCGSYPPCGYIIADGEQPEEKQKG